jgi:D(-)-tartrate dehydratase
MNPTRAFFSRTEGLLTGVPVENSYVGLPDVPGIGFEAKSNLCDVLRTLL